MGEWAGARGQGGVHGGTVGGRRARVHGALGRCTALSRASFGLPSRRKPVIISIVGVAGVGGCRAPKGPRSGNTGVVKPMGTIMRPMGMIIMMRMTTITIMIRITLTTMVIVIKLRSRLITATVTILMMIMILVMSMLTTAGEHTKSHQVDNQIGNGNDDADNNSGNEHDNYEGRTPKGGITINETRFE